MPTVNPGNDQIEAVREIAKLSAFIEAQSRIDSLNNEQWAATESDITLWNSLKNQFTQLKGGRSGVIIDPGKSRLEIRNRVRVRLGLPELETEYGVESLDNCGRTESIPIDFLW